MLCGLPLEARCLVSTTVRPGRLCEGPGGRLVIAGGIGRERASSAVARLVEAGALALISVGTAAGLRVGLRPGRVLLPRRVVAADGRSLAVDLRWHEAWLRCCADLQPLTEDLLECDHVLRTPADKQALRGRGDAAGCDMESAAVLEAASAAGLPGMVLRVVVDDAARALPAAAVAAVDAEGGLRPGALAGALLANPADIRGLLTLALDMRLATMTLRRLASRRWPPPPGDVPSRARQNPRPAASAPIAGAD